MFWHQWFLIVRDVLEALYFLSGIALLVVAFLGLRQIRIAAEQLRLTKEVANISAKREAIKMAAERCQYYADKSVSASDKLVREYVRLGLSFLGGSTKGSIQKGEFVDANYDARLWNAEFPKIGTILVDYLNSLGAC